MSTSIQNSSHPALSGADGLATSMSDIVLLIGRIFIGWIFVRSGYGKLFDIPAYAATFPARGLPTFLAYIAVPSEFFGGLALMFGLRNSVRRACDDRIHAGGHVQLAPLLGFHRRSRTTRSGLKFLQKHGHPWRHLLSVRLRCRPIQSRRLAAQTALGMAARS